jgi:hypothetical protein
MGISQYIKEIGRGKDGARALNRSQATDLFGQVLDGSVTDLEVGAFCLAMRIKGETADEMAGFLDATQARLNRVPDNGLTTVVLPSYNGSRKMANLTPLLCMLLVRRGVPVLMHGVTRDPQRLTSAEIFSALGIAHAASGAQAEAPTAVHLHQQSADPSRQATLARLVTHHPGFVVGHGLEFSQRVAASSRPKRIGAVQHQALAAQVGNILQALLQHGCAGQLNLFDFLQPRHRLGAQQPGQTLEPLGKRTLACRQIKNHVSNVTPLGIHRHIATHRARQASRNSFRHSSCRRS